MFFLLQIFEGNFTVTISLVPKNGKIIDRDRPKGKANPDPEKGEGAPSGYVTYPTRNAENSRRVPSYVSKSSKVNYAQSRIALTTIQ